MRTASGRVGVWLDTPLTGSRTWYGKLLINIFRPLVLQYERYGVDIRKDPVLIYPTLHYQNGGVKIDENSETPVKNLFVAGETSGGLHGRNRLMGKFLIGYHGIWKAGGINRIKSSQILFPGKVDACSLGTISSGCPKTRRD